MIVKLTKAYKKFKKGQKLEVTNALAKELEANGFLRQNKTRKKDDKKEKFESNESAGDK